MTLAIARKLLLNNTNLYIKQTTNNSECYVTLLVTSVYGSGSNDCKS